MIEWLELHTVAVQAPSAAVTTLLTLALVATTIFYAREARRSRFAADKTAAAANDQLELLRLQYERVLGQGPEVVREALLGAKKLVEYWKPYVLTGNGNPHAVPDPGPLMALDLARSVEHARNISRACADLILSAVGDLRCAKGEFDRIKQSYRGPTMSPASVSGSRADALPSSSRQSDRRCTRHVGEYQRSFLKSRVSSH